jgi:CPA2 family monovalent cation:H+ antiporter-2
MSEQLAEVGVILMMFGVGLHLKWENLLKVRSIAISGAIIQTLVAASVGMFILYLFGWPLKVGAILGLAISVASTVVLVRMLGEQKLLTSKEGYVSVGWLIVEDIITIIILLLLPTFAQIDSNLSLYNTLLPLLFLGLKLTALTLLLVIFSKKVLSYLLSKVLRIHSQELFTLSILALIFLLATVISLFFGISIALGAFIAGLVIRQTKAHHKALVHSQSMKDAFIAIFFLSVGMLFNPIVIVNNFYIFISILGVILIIKPVTAFIISILLKHPLKVAFTIAAGLAQIGEFSFILAEESLKFGFMTDEGYDIIVACALISIMNL